MTALLALGLSAWSPAAAYAGPLLSGYGGPGDGAQALLGSALLNGPSQGGPPAAAQATKAPDVTVSQNAGAGGGGGERGDVGGSAGAARRASGGTGRSPRRDSGAGAASAQMPVRALAARSEALGVSSMDLVYIALAVAALIVVAAFTMSAARSSPHGDARPSSAGRRTPNN